VKSKYFKAGCLSTNCRHELQLKVSVYAMSPRDKSGVACRRQRCHVVEPERRPDCRWKFESDVLQPVTVDGGTEHFLAR
jgi:hypothetical protein